MSNNNSFMTDASNQQVIDQKKNTGQLAEEGNYSQEANLSRKIEFDKGMPLSFSFESNKVFTIPFTFKGYLTFIWKKIAETPLNLCMVVVLLFYLIAFLIDKKMNRGLDLFYSVAFHLFMLFIEILFTSIKYIRIYINDLKVNNQIAHIYDMDQRDFVDQRWKEIKVGQIIRINNNEVVPADIILLEAMDHKHQCYVDNSSINGNFDMFTIKKACNDTHAATMKVIKFAEYVKNIKGILKYEEPNSNMNSFNGRLKLESFPRASDINLENFVMRGATIKNVKHVYGLVVYTGMETKMMMTLKFTQGTIGHSAYGDFTYGSTAQLKKNQFNQVIIKKDNEFIRQSLKYMQYYIIILYLVVLIILLLMGFHEAFDVDDDQPLKDFFEYKDSDTTLYELFIGFTRIVLTFHIFMPFNWFGLIEIAYSILSCFVEWDENIKRDKDEKVEIINNYSLANFGQVRHILTDKTGTLTKRIFELKLCSIHGKIYNLDFDNLKDESYIYRIKEDDINELEILQEIRSQSKYSPLIKEFIETLCLCHSVKVSNLNSGKKNVPQPNANEIKGAEEENVQNNQNEQKDFASPYCEEVATFKVLKKFGYKLLISKANIIQLKINDKKRNFVILGHNKYNKDRKKMSVVIQHRTSEGSYLLCKANDMSAFDLINKEEKDTPEIIKSKEQIKELSKFGFRYFILLKKELNKEETTNFLNKYKSAENYVVKSDEHLNNLAKEYEKDLSFLGVIFFEEKIDQDLKYSISRLNNAGIKVWIASGDKRENVISIGRALDLYDPKSIRGDFSDKDKPEDLDIKMSTLLMQFLFPNDKINKMKTRTGASVDVKSMKNGSSKDLTILISGNCFTRICNDQRNFQSLATLLSYCTSLLAYQFSPNNKFVLCQMIKNYCAKNSRLLAVGDGFNDFSMLRDADLSVGILSREILQVRNTCDVIVSNFSQIVDLILVHGTWNYRKILKIGLISFYLHFLLLIPKLLYLNDNLYGYCFYDEYNLIFVLNVLILNLYCLFMITFDIPVERALITLNYNIYRDNIYDNDSMIFKFGVELIKALIDSVLIFFLNREMAVISYNIEGESVDISMLGSSILNTSYILIIVKTLIFYLHFINYIHVIIIIITSGCLVGVVFIKNAYKEDLLFGLTHLNILLTNLLIIVICFAYEFAANNILFLFDYDFLSKITMIFKKNIKNYLFLKNYQQLLTNIAREVPKIPNKLDKITYPEVLKRIYSFNKQLDPALENMADVSNDDASNLRIRKPILKFYDIKLEMDYTEFCDIKVTFSYLVYLLTMAIFLAIDIVITGFEGQKFSKVMKIVYIISGLLLLIPKLKSQFSNAFSIYFAIIVIIEIIAVYVNKENDNDTKLCLQLFVVLAFPLYYNPKTGIILLLVCLYILGITPALYINDFGFQKFYPDSNFICSNLSLVYLRHISIYGMVSLLIISSHYIQLKNRIEFLKYHKSRIELKKDNLIMANLIPEFVRAKMQRGERGAAYGYEEVTIVFCDISNFDELMAKLTPKDIISFLDEFYSVLDQFCQLHGLQKIETVGKTYMAAGGIRECEIDVDKNLLRVHHSIRCFEFAVDILDLVQKMILNSGDKITVKIGIHKGKVIPAVVGDHKPQFSLIGDTVNTTSRMCSNGEKNCITCSEFAYEEIKTKYKNCNIYNKQIKGKGLMNLYSYDINHNKKQTLENPKGPIAKDQSGNIITKSSTKKVAVLVKQNTRNSHRNNSMIKSSEISEHESFLLNKKSLIEDSFLIVENSQEMLIKTGVGAQQDNFFSNLNKYDNNTNAYNYGNYSGFDDRKNINSSSIVIEKKEPKFENIKNTYFSDSILFYRFKNDVSKNGFTRFENIIVNQSKIRSMYTNICLFFLLLFGVYVNSHYTAIDSEYSSYLQVKTALMLLLIVFIFVIDKLMQNYPIFMFIYITIVYLCLTINNVVFNSYLDDYNLINMAVEEIVILTAIEACGILKYLHITINILLHIIVYIVDIVTNINEPLIRKYNIFLILISVIKLVYITTLYFNMTSIFLANQKESKTLVDTEKMLFNLMPLHVVQNMKDDIPVADVLENVTLLFADIVRYTDFGNCHEPVEVVKMLMELFKNFDHAAKACHVYKVHTIGDCYVVMGFNGKVSMNERNFYDEAKNVCKMGEEMINIIRDVRKRVNYELLDMRIGIHTGTVIAGIIGSSVVRYDIFGSDVLIANKMESSGCPGRINISEDTKKLLESKDLPYNLSVNKVVHIDAANRDITCFLIDNGQQDAKK